MHFSIYIAERNKSVLSLLLFNISCPTYFASYIKINRPIPMVAVCGSLVAGIAVGIPLNAWLIFLLFLCVVLVVASGTA